MKTWRGEMTAGGRSLAEAKIQEVHYHRSIHNCHDATKPHSENAQPDKISGSQENFNHLMYMDNIRLYTKNEKELETLINAVRT